MSGFSHFLLSFCILAYILCGSRAWRVKIPSRITGLLGSCLVIPCTFDYKLYPPRQPDRVVWFQYARNRYPKVYDKLHPRDVLPIFYGKTRVIKNHNEKKCSLVINPVMRYHHRQRIYPWIDPENIGRHIHKFYETTVLIEVVERAEEPDIMIIGSMEVGNSVTVQCTVYHTCAPKPPALRLNIPLQRPSLTHVPMSGGKINTTLMATMVIERARQTVECLIRHWSGQHAKATKTLTAQCSFAPLIISHTADEFVEDQESSVTCTASYTCPNHRPALKWNYDHMPASSLTSRSGAGAWKTVSTLTFTASTNDHGRSLTCYARFTGGQRQQQSITLRVKRNMLSRGWSFTTPPSITGMRGSCIIFPCTFTYTISQPADLRVIWYLFQTNGYPIVFDVRQNIIPKFSGITSLIGSVGKRNCSLKIERLAMSHNQDRLYPWIDQNPIASYQMSRKFHKKTSQLIVSDEAQEPQVSIIGIPMVGEESIVSCNVHHTCISAPPTLTLKGIPGKDVFMDTLVSDGIWERTVERTWVVKEEDQSVRCTVSYAGGQKATSELKLNVECPYDKITMTERPGQATEGVAKSVICSVSYKCKKNKPTIKWNYEDMQSSLKTKQISHNTYNTVSNLTFIGSLEDDGKSLTCTAQFATGKTSDNEALRIKKYERPYNPHEKNASRLQAADVPFRFNALTGSCVVIPCSFSYQVDMPVTRGVWSKKSGDIIYHNAPSYVADHFKGRTRILGDLNEGNCSLEIDDIKPFDNGPFCFHVEKENDRYRFNNSCVFIVMKASPEKLVMTSVPAEVDAGSMITVSCSVKHTCPSHWPVFSWSVPNLTSEVTHTWMPEGIWKTNSTITFMATGDAGVKNLTCTAISWRNKRRASTVQLTVKESTSWTVAIAVSAVFLTVIILAAVFGVLFYRKRRTTEDRERPPRPEKRGSIWRRFSRAEDGRVKRKNKRGPRDQGNTGNLSVKYINRRPPHSVGPEDDHVYDDD